MTIENVDRTTRPTPGSSGGYVASWSDDYARRVSRVLVTGMSGAGKSTLLEELSRRGFVTVDTDYGGWERADGTWDEPRMTALLDSHATLAVSGTVPNQVRFYDRFEHIVLLTAPLDVLLERLVNRTTNPYGHAADERADVARYVDEVEPLLRRGASQVLDGRLPLAQLAGTMERLLRSS